MGREQIRPEVSGTKRLLELSPLIDGLSRIYRGIVNYTAKQNYRADLRREAVARASAIRQSNQEKKEVPEKKPRGRKAKAAVEKES